VASIPDKTMADSATLRRMMVDGQVRPADVTSRPLLQAMLDIPREPFVPAAQVGLAYLDMDLPVGEGGRRLLKPMVLSKMLQALEISADSRVLDVGCATGYAAALLSRFSASVVALEEQPALAAQARANLVGLGNVAVVEGRLADGHAAGGPYEAILVEGAIDLAPDRLCQQLAEGGRLVCILGTGPAAKATIFRRDADDITARTIFDAAASALPGFAKPKTFAF
jgi:protein-L-isoaspartate(D-aspartate) O-methyltransferase